MTQPTLGRLRRVDLRKVWESEPGGFTPWLAREENLKLLGDTIGIELELESQEKPVGPYRADVLCKDTATDQWVVIENQLERTDHTHLGQLLTYAAGLQAVTVVWIAERITEEHRATLDWLNERTDEQIYFFGLEIELWQIGDSPIAPKFNVVSQPNDWSRTVQQSAAGEVSEHKQLQLRFWAAFRDYMEDHESTVRCQKPSPRHWYTHAVGRSGIHLASVVSSWSSSTGEHTPEIRAELVLNGLQSKQRFRALENGKSEIEKALAFPLTWLNPEDREKCRIYTRQDADFTNEALWPQQFEWLRTRQEALLKVFAPLVKDL